MIAMKRRLGAPVLLSALSLGTFLILLRNPHLSTHLTDMPKLGNGLWQWGFQDENEFVDGVRLVVLGDSWADNMVEKGQEGRGRSWTDSFCAELNCTSNINLAVSQSSISHLLELPTGAVTSNKIHENAASNSEFMLSERANLTLPDLTKQVQSFISLPPPINEHREIIFAISIGFWDVYHFAGLDYQHVYNHLDDAIEAIVVQLDILYSHFRTNLTKLSKPSNETLLQPPSTFRIIIPKLVDPSLLPGWQTQRPIPIPPSSVAEQQKHAVYLTSRWNTALENRLARWINISPEFGTDLESQKHTRHNAEKELFYYDLPSFICNLVIERSLEIEGLTDENGLGKSESQLVDVYLPCMSEEGITKNVADEFVELDGKTVCRSPRTYLWWDGWTLGGLASEEVGKNIGAMVKAGNSWGLQTKKAEG